MPALLFIFSFVLSIFFLLLGVVEQLVALSDLPEVPVTESAGLGGPYRIWTIPVGLDVVLNEPVTHARFYAIAGVMIPEAGGPG